MKGSIKHKIRSIIGMVLLVTLLLSTPSVDQVLGWAFRCEYPFVTVANAATNDTESTAETGETAADAAGTTYVSEVKVFQGSDPNQLKKQIEEEGYQYFDQNMNEGAGGNYTYLAYKTTTNRDEAITNLKILGQDTGWMLADYGRIMDQNYDYLQPLASQMFAACGEFSKKLAEGSPAAKFSYDMLNMMDMVIKEDGEEIAVPLGQYLTDMDHLNSTGLFHIITRATADMVNAIYKYLALGVSDYGTDNWCERLSQNGMVVYQPAVKTASPSEVQETIPVVQASTSTATRQEKAFWDKQDNLYYSSAEEMKSVLVMFAQNVTEGQAYLEAHDGKFANENPENDNKTTEDIVEDIVQERCERMMEDEDSNAERDQKHKEEAYPIYLSAYEIFKQYSFDCPAYGTKTVGDYLVALGNDLAKEDTKEAYRNAYALLRDLSPAQYAMTRLCGIHSLTTSLTNTEEGMKGGYDELNKIKEAMKRDGITTRMTVWDGADMGIYDEKVAVTDRVARGMNADRIINREPYKTWFDDVQSFVAKYRFWFQTAVDICGALASAVEMGTILFAGQTLGALCSAATAVGWTAAPVTMFFASIGVVLSYVSVVTMAIAMIFAIYDAITDIYNYFKRPDEEEIDYQKDKIPLTIFDQIERKDKSGAYYYAEYRAVYNQLGEVADINGYTQKKWNCLYYTKVGWEGSPLTMNNLHQEIFKSSKTEVQLKEKGYQSLNLFGNDAAANLNANTNNVSSSIYLFFQTEEGLKEIAGGESEEDPKKDNPPEGTEYLADLKVYCDTWYNMKTHLARLKNQGYTIVDQDLSPGIEYGVFGWADSGRSAYRDMNTFSTYIAYKTTTKPDNAIRDIRVAPYYVTGSFVFGNASYTIAGNIKDEQAPEGGRLVDGAGLYYTCNKNAGDPILADFKISRTILPWDNEEGWEPITGFAGGNAYDFFHTGFCDSYSDVNVPVCLEYDYSDREGAQNTFTANRYVYFRTTTNYNADKDAPTYIGGITFVGGTTIPTYVLGSDDTEYTVKDFISQLGLYDPDINIAENGAGQSYDVSQYLCFSLTHNPNRAIYDIQTYESMNNITIFNQVRGSSTRIGYSICESYTQRKKKPFKFGYDAHTLCEKVRSARCISPTHHFRNIYLTSGEMCTPESGGGNILNVDMYVCGKTSGKSPLKLEDVVFSKTKEVPEGFVGVNSFINDLSEEPYNLRLRNSEKNPLYMYKKGKISRGKYIKKISIGIGKGDMAIAEALSKAGENVELIPINFADGYGDDNETKLLGKYAEKLCFADNSKLKFWSENFLWRYSDPVFYKEGEDIKLTREMLYDYQYLMGDGRALDLESDEYTVPEHWDYYTEGRDFGSIAGVLNDIKFSDVYRNDDGVMYTAAQRGVNCQDYKNLANYNAGNCAFLMVERTNSSSCITGLVKVRKLTGDAADTIRVNDVEYKKVPTSGPIPSNHEFWYLYSRSNKYEAGITDITMDNEISKNGWKTVKCAEFYEDHSPDWSLEIPGENNTGSFHNRASDKLYLHTKIDESYCYYENLFIGSGKTAKLAKADALNKGADCILDYNLNQNAGGNYVYLGYTMTDYMDDAISDMIVTNGKSYEETYDEITRRNTITIDGDTYFSAGILIQKRYYQFDPYHDDGYYMDGDLSLNDGTKGDELYLYYRPYKSGDALKPYVSLYAGMRDNIPVVFSKEYLQKNFGIETMEDITFDAGENIEKKYQDEKALFRNVKDSDLVYVYERILDDKGEGADLNRGLYATYKGMDVESCIYLYGAREGKGIKENPKAATFERNGNDIYLYGYYGIKANYGDIVLVKTN